MLCWQPHSEHTPPCISHSPVPAPGIPRPSRGRMVPTPFLFLSHTPHTLLFSCPHTGLLQTKCFLPSSLATYVSPIPLCSRPILRSCFPPSFNLFFCVFLSCSPLSCSLIRGLFAWQSVKDAASVSVGQRGPPVSVQGPADISNARQRGDKMSRPARTERPLCFPLLSNSSCSSRTIPCFCGEMNGDWWVRGKLHPSLTRGPSAVHLLEGSERC